MSDYEAPTTSRSPISDALATASPGHAVTAVLNAHNGMDPTTGTCLGCGEVFAEGRAGSWIDVKAAFERHQWEALGALLALVTGKDDAPGDLAADGPHTYMIEVLANPGSQAAHWVISTDEFVCGDREAADAERDLLIQDGHAADHVRVVGLVVA